MIFGRGVAGRALDRDLDDLRGALAIAHDLRREIEQHAVHRLDESGKSRIVRIVDRLAAGSAGREEQQRVGGRGVAIDRDAVVGEVAQLRDQRLANLRPKIGVSEHVVQRRRHVRLDHARSLGDADDGDIAAVEIDDLACSLGERVGRPDAVGDLLQVGRAELAPRPVSTPPETMCGGSGSPITPVAETNTSWSLHPDIFSAEATVARFLAMPAAPVKALELPVFTTSTRALPPPAFSAARHQSTSSERVEELVKMPPADAPFGKVHDQQIVAHLALVEAERMRRRPPCRRPSAAPGTAPARAAIRAGPVAVAKAKRLSTGRWCCGGVAGRRGRGRRRGLARGAGWRRRRRSRLGGLSARLASSRRRRWRSRSAPERAPPVDGAGAAAGVAGGGRGAGAAAGASSREIARIASSRSPPRRAAASGSSPAAGLEVAARSVSRSSSIEGGCSLAHLVDLHDVPALSGPRTAARRRRCGISRITRANSGVASSAVM